MPNAKVLSEKQAIVAELTEKIQKATAGVIVDYKGITVEEDTALRKECREGGVDYAVVKKLDKVRHFIFVDDKKAFTEKKNMVIFRGKVKGKPSRKLFITFIRLLRETKVQISF